MKRILLFIFAIFGFSSCAEQQASNILNSQQQTSMERKVLDYVNEYRNSRNLSPLVPVDSFAQIARTHSIAMQGKNKIDHSQFFGRATKIQNSHPKSKIAENVGYNHGFSSPEKHMVDSWINSEGHQRNMVGDYRYTGIGITKSAEGKIYYTQLFVNH